MLVDSHFIVIVPVAVPAADSAVGFTAPALIEISVSEHSTTVAFPESE